MSSTLNLLLLQYLLLRLHVCFVSSSGTLCCASFPSLGFCFVCFFLSLFSSSLSISFSSLLVLFSFFCFLYCLVCFFSDVAAFVPPLSLPFLLLLLFSLFPFVLFLFDCPYCKGLCYFQIIVKSIALFCSTFCIRSFLLHLVVSRVWSSLLDFLYFTRRAFSP